MRKIVLLIIFICCISIGNSQVRFGVKAGINLTDFSYSNIYYGSSYQSKTNFNLGIMLSVPLSPVFYLQPEMVYSGQGAIYNDIPNSVTLQYNYDYLNVPVLIKYQSVAGFFIETGPQIGLLLSAADTKTNMDQISNSNTIEFAWAAGLGYQITKIHLGIDVRYNIGISNVNTTYDLVGPMHNSVYQFGVFYLFSK
jgi:hypothetical protein